MNLKKGAMFGLDARIALAIFGALSVISGAALFSAIQQSKVISAVSTMNEISKSIESYIIDTGVNMPDHATAVGVLDPNELISSSVTGWKGPYTSLTTKGFMSSVDSVFDIPSFNAHSAIVLKKENIANPDGLELCTVSEADCYIWVSLHPIDNEIAFAIDEYVDGEQNDSTGNIRLTYVSDSTKTVRMKAMRVLN